VLLVKKQPADFSGGFFWGIKKAAESSTALENLTGFLKSVCITKTVINL
jgi:hypothetical protein